MPPDLQAVLDLAWQSAQRLAIDVIEYPPEQRDEVMRRMGGLFAEVALEAAARMRWPRTSAPQWSRPCVTLFRRSRPVAVVQAERLLTLQTYRAI